MSESSFILRTRRHPSAILLVVQLLGMILYPFLENMEGGKIVFNAFGIVVLGFTTNMVRGTPGQTWISACLAGPVIVLLILQSVFRMPELLPWSSALEALFYFYAAGSLIAYMMADRCATRDELFAAGATFTLLAWAFTHLFVMIQAIEPNTFGAAVNADAPRTWTELNYLSFALLSSTGIGDVIPLTSHARAVASIEMFTGLIYLAAVVARLIGFTVQSNRDDSRPR